MSQPRGRGGAPRGNFRGGGGFSGRGGRGGYGGAGRGAPSGPNLMFQDVPVIDNAIQAFEDQCVQQNKSVPLQEKELVRRPGYGVQGRKIILRANFFSLDFSPNAPGFYCHKVVIKPEPSPQRHARQLFEQLMRTQEIAPLGAATDGSTEIVCTTKIVFNPRDFTVDKKDNGEGKSYRISLNEPELIKHVDLVSALKNAKPTGSSAFENAAIRALNILMTGAPSKDLGVVIKGKGCKFFWTDNRKQVADLKGGLECIRGFFSSIRPAAGRVLINMNTNHSAFYRPGPLFWLLGDFNDVFGKDNILLNRYIRGVRVELTHLLLQTKDDGSQGLRQKSIWGLASPRDGSRTEHPPRVPHLGANADLVEFYMEEHSTGKGRYISVTDYYKKTYNMVLKNRTMPVVNVGSSDKPTYLPADVCKILPGQIYNGELGTTQRQNIINFSCRRPPDNFNSINSDGMKIMGVTDTRTQKFGIQVNPGMVAVPGRILNPPSLKYGTARQVPSKGSWNLVGKKFCEGAAIKSWTGVLLQKKGFSLPGSNTTTPELTRALEKFWTCAKNLGISWPKPSPCAFLGFERDQMHERVDEMFRKAATQVSFIVILLPMQEDRIFNYIKWVGDTRAGVLTHCCSASKFLQGNDQYLANNAMKVNLKMGGICQSLEMPQSSRLLNAGKTMVVGLDVTHPSPTDTEAFPSIACIVASIDSRVGQWPGEARIQMRRVETIQPLQAMMGNCLERWVKKNKQLPLNILIYRDGVSEGQYQMVLNEELKSIKTAAQLLYKGRPPNITIVVCGKRHNVRFFPTRESDADRTNNPLNGTVVDRVVTRPQLWDFYLQAQAPIQGSARPAHYVVIHDEIFTNPAANPDHMKPADTLQELTHNICYMMGRCTRSISYSTPAFLADKFCDRARKYVRAHFTKEMETRDSAPLSTPPQSVVKLADQIIDSMVYI